MEALLIYDNLELLLNDSDVPTSLQYNGNGTNPDLTSASPDIADDVGREFSYVPGLGMIVTEFSFTINKSPVKTS
ncbi:hypothetical protein CEXT_585931 [Caerostris extrusa]|uniref:Uncharacterized protein n=1 Tax=Caerostris extrusa TaxID=172846 RepID=A0AAV4VUT2_CAEEX|nr:hypothetical protein CEXT_585931 [Caerostris extrusa]